MRSPRLCKNIQKFPDLPQPCIYYTVHGLHASCDTGEVEIHDADASVSTSGTMEVCSTIEIDGTSCEVENLATNASSTFTIIPTSSSHFIHR